MPSKVTLRRGRFVVLLVDGGVCSSSASEEVDDDDREEDDECADAGYNASDRTVGEAVGGGWCGGAGAW